MAKDDPLPTKVWNGRILYSQTHWWAEQNKDWSPHLYCIHSVALNAECKECANAE